MKKIPKLGINNFVYKSYTLRDIVLIAFFILLTSAFVSSQNKILWVFSGINVILIILLMLKINNERIYVHISHKIKYAFGKQVYRKSNSEISRFFNFKTILKDGNIKMYAGGVAQLWEIGKEKFFSIDGDQDEYISEYYRMMYNAVSNYGNFKIIKVNMNGCYNKAIKKRDNILKDVNLERKKLIREEVDILKRFSEEEDLKQNVYYMVYYAPNIEKLQAIEKNLNNIISRYELPFIKVKDQDLIKKIILEQNMCFSECTDIDSINKVAFSDLSVSLNNKKKWIITIDNLSGDVPFGYLSEVLNLNSATVTINAQLEDRATAMNKLDRTVMDYSADLQNTGVSSKAIMLEDEIDAITNIITDLKNGDDVFFKVHITILCDSIEQRKYILSQLKNIGIKGSIKRSRLKDEFSFHQLLNLKPIKEKDRPIYMSSSLLAYAYPFLIKATNDTDGEILGEGECGDLTIVDFNKRGSMYTNSNIVIVGKAGSGKSYLTKMLVTSFLTKGEYVYILDPENEYKAIAKNLGGDIVDLASEDFTINPLDPLSSSGEFNLGEHLNFLDSFFHNIFKLKEEEIELINRSIIRLFLKFNISDESANNIKSNEFPIFSDLENQVKQDREEDMANRDYYDHILIQMLKCTKGRYAKLWNKHTKIEINNSFVVFNFQNVFSSMNINFAMAQMQLVSKYLNNRLIENYNKIKNKEGHNSLNIIVDEAHRFIDEENRVALKMMYVFAKQCRKYGCKLITVTQSIADFLSTPAVLKESKALISETQYLFLFAMSPQHINDTKILFENSSLSDLELDVIKSQQRGECILVSSNKEKECIKIILNKEAAKIIE